MFLLHPAGPRYAEILKRLFYAHVIEFKIRVVVISSFSILLYNANLLGWFYEKGLIYGLFL